MLRVKVTTAGAAVGWQGAVVRKLAAAISLGLVGCALAACSGVSDVVPRPSEAMAPIAPRVVSQPETIVVPVPIQVSLPASSSPRAERRFGSVKIGRPYEVAGNWYYPSPGGGYDEEGVASWYGPDFQGKSTANGELYNMNRLTAAHPTLPMPCYATVTNMDNGRTIVVRINDRGPYKAGRIIDLSHRAAQLLAVTHSGTANVRVRYLKMAPLMADERFEEQFLARQPWYHGPQYAANETRRPASLLTVQLRPTRLEPGWQPETFGNE